MGGGAGRTCKAQLNIIKDPKQFVCTLSKCVKTIVLWNQTESNDVAQVESARKEGEIFQNCRCFLS